MSRTADDCRIGVGGSYVCSSDLRACCPAKADLHAKRAAGVADSLATTLLLATDKPALAVPAMNVRMWEHTATRRNVERLREDGVMIMQPDEGPMACGEFGEGRLPDPEAILQEISKYFSHRDRKSTRLNSSH